MWFRLLKALPGTLCTTKLEESAGTHYVIKFVPILYAVNTQEICTRETEAVSNYIFLGPPGAGKGTMAAMLSAEYGHAHISTGDILRDEMRNETELGKEAKRYVESGELVPDAVVAAIVSNKLGQPDVQSSGFILDGYPRTVVQAELLDEALARQECGIDAVVLFEVGRDLLIKRLTARRLCKNCGAVYNTLFNPPQKDNICDNCGSELYQRPDDNSDTVSERLRVYEAQTKPLIDVYEKKGLLLRVPGSKEKNENFRTLCDALGLD